MTRYVPCECTYEFTCGYHAVRDVAAERVQVERERVIGLLRARRGLPPTESPRNSRDATRLYINWRYDKVCVVCGEKAGWIGQRGLRAGFCSRCITDTQTLLMSERKKAARADRSCESCGISFTPGRSDGRFCSRACRQKAYRERLNDNLAQP